MDNLKKQKLWVLWQYEIVNSRPTKVLYSAKGTRCGTNAKFRSQWVTYDEVIDVLYSTSFDGIGFVIPEGMVVIDIDDSTATDPLAAEILSITGSYAETSPSGKGLHILAYVDTSKVPQTNGKLSSTYYCKNPHNKVEMYFGGLTNRYMTFTEDKLNQLPIRDITEQLFPLLDTYMKKEHFKKDTNTSTELDDLCIIDIARRAKNKDKFIALFDNGDISRYPSHSEADQALCNILAFYTGGDADRIESLFSQSQLVTDKWTNREDYRKRTIEVAIQGCSGKFYTPTAPLPPYIYFDERSKKIKVNCPLLAAHIRQDLDYIFVRDSAKGGVLRYVYDNGYYRLYADDMLKGIIKGYITEFDETLLRMSDVNEVFQQITTDLVFITDEDLNADEDLINFQNGFLQISTMTLLPHSTEILSTIQLSCDWKDTPTATPVFDQFMDTLTSGDKGLQKLLLQFIGVCLSNIKGWRMKKALFMVGAGDTGKSQLKNLVERLLGKMNYVGIDLKEIEARFGTSNIYGKRLAGSSDMSFLSVDELKTFKKCTGGDSLFAEFKGQNGFEFTYNGLLWFCMNKLPKFGGDNGKWVYDRIMQVTCNNVIPPEKQDKHLTDKLYAERDGIVYKAVLALKQVIANGYAFSEPTCIIEARKDYMAENNTVISFFEECMEQRPKGKICDSCTTGKVYDVYKAWCFDNNHGYSKTAREFRDELSRYLNTPYADLVTRRGKGGNFYRDYTLTEDAKETYKKAYGYDSFGFLASS